MVAILQIAPKDCCLFVTFHIDQMTLCDFEVIKDILASALLFWITHLEKAAVMLREHLTAQWRGPHGEELRGFLPQQ